MFRDDDTDSYHEATDGLASGGQSLKDDNLTALGTLKSYRKTPFASKSVVNIDLNELDSVLKLTGNTRAGRDDHLLPIHDLLTRLNSDAQCGLTPQQVRANLEIFGPNCLLTEQELRNVPLWVRICKCFLGGPTLFLWLAFFMCTIHFAIDSGQSSSPDGRALALAAACVVAIVSTGVLALLGEVEGGNNDSFTGTKEKGREGVMAVRDGEEMMVSTQDLVPGDILILTTNDICPADCRVLECSESLLVDDSKLTGRSEASLREVSDMNTGEFNPESVELAPNIVLAQCRVIRGKCRAVVTRTGVNTFFAQMLEDALGQPKCDTYFSNELRQLMDGFTTFALLTATSIFVITLLLADYYWLDAVLVFIGVLLSLVPVSLIGLFNLGLSIVSKRLKSLNVKVHNLQALEALGSTSILVVDKTGTLTHSNQRVVAHVWFDEQMGELDTFSLAKLQAKPVATSFDIKAATWRLINRALILCNPSSIRRDRHQGVSFEGGTPYDVAMLNLAEGLSSHRTEQLRRDYRKVAEIAYNPIIKFQISIHEEGQGHILFLIGSADVALRRCSSAIINGECIAMDDNFLRNLNSALTQLTDDLGESNVVAVCQAQLDARYFPLGFVFDVHNLNFPLNNLSLLGLVSFFEATRESVPESLAKCQASGVKIIMASGEKDANAARAVARSAGVLSIDQMPRPDEIFEAANTTSCLVSGTCLSETLSDEEIDNLLIHYPEIVLYDLNHGQKGLIVSALRRLGAVVTMVGDGINDTQALRTADAGVLVDQYTDDKSCRRVLEDVTDIHLTNGDFNALVTAIEEGRLFFANMRHLIFFVLANKTAQITCYLLALMANLPFALGPLTVLTIDLITSLPTALALVFEERDVTLMMKQGPRNPFLERLVDDRIVFAMSHVGLFQSAAALSSYFMLMAQNGFWPSRLLDLRTLWDSRAINDLTDSYDQEWTYPERKTLERSCYSICLWSMTTIQITALMARRAFSGHSKSNIMLYIALVSQAILTLFLIYFPGLNVSLQFEALSIHFLFAPIAFVFVVVLYEAIRAAVAKKHPQGWVARKTNF